MRKIFLDTNIWLRFFLKDNEKQYQDVWRLFSLIEEGKLRPYTSTIVLLEVNYILDKVYHLPPNRILAYFTNIMRVRNITIVESTNLAKALGFYKKYKIKFADCLIASQLPKESAICTYDRDFSKIQNLSCLTPDTISNPF